MASHRSVALSKLDHESSDSVESAFEVFSVPHSHTSTVKAEWVEVQPERENTGGIIEFDVPGSDDLYTDLNQTFLEVEVKIKLANGNNLPADALQLVVPGDNFMHSLFQTATVKIEGIDVEYEPNYPHRAYLENLLNYGKEAKETRLEVSSGWYEDAGQAKNFAQMGAAVAERRAKSALSRTQSFYGKLRLSSFAQPRNLVPGVRWLLRLARTTPEICLMSTDNAPAGGAKVEITKCILWVRKVQANPALQQVQAEMIQSGAEVKIPIDRIRTTFYVTPIGIMSRRINLGNNTQRPNRLIVGLISHAAKSGQYTTNPFRFAHCNVNGIELQIDGLPVGKRYEPDFTNNVYGREYASLFANTGRMDSDSGNGITRASFADGHALYAFDNSGDLCGGDEGIHLVKNGSLTVYISFSEATTETLSLFVYQEFDDIIVINKERRVFMTSSVL